MTLSQYEGYTIVISDQNGNAFFRTKVKQNMNEQWPTGNLSLFRSFDGYVEHFYLTDEVKDLSPTNHVSLRNDPNALIDLYMTKEYHTSAGF